MSKGSQPTNLIALILAGRRATAEDPLADYSSHHKALIDIGGQPMIARVLSALSAIPDVQDVWISSTEDLKERLGFAKAGDKDITLKSAGASPASTIETALNDAPNGAEILVTTCDHALLTPEMINAFLSQINRNESDVAAACVTRDVFAGAYPDAKRTFIKFSDVSFSGANLFWFRTDRAAPLVAFWRRLEDNRKHPAKMAAEIGVVTGLRYLAGLLSKSDAVAAIEKKTGVRVALIELPYAEAAIDVDKPADILLVRAIVESRLRNNAQAIPSSD